MLVDHVVVPEPLSQGVCTLIGERFIEEIVGVWFQLMSTRFNILS